MSTFIVALTFVAMDQFIKHQMKTLLLTTLLLTSCQSKKIDATLYQPKTLILEANVEIPTAEGKYRPQFKEVWHSQQRVDDLERKLSNF